MAIAIGRRRIGGPTRRDIGPVGTATRIALGLVLLAPAARGSYDLAELTSALLALPAVVTVGMAWRAHHRPQPSRAGGLSGHAVLLALFLTPWYAPALRVTSGGLLVYLGVSMLLAAARGCAGCEVMALPNWLLGRHDQVGRLVNSPVDGLERRLRGRNRAVR